MGIPLSNERHLRNVGELARPASELPADSSRVDPPCLLRDPHNSLLHTQVRAKEGGSRETVCELTIVAGRLKLILSREIQLFLVGYIIVEICEIFTVGGFPLDSKVRLVVVAQLYSCC